MSRRPNDNRYRYINARVPPAIKQAIEKRAAENKRTPSGELVALLRAALGEKRL